MNAAREDDDGLSSMHAPGPYFITRHRRSGGPDFTGLALRDKGIRALDVFAASRPVARAEFFR